MSTEPNTPADAGQTQEGTGQADAGAIQGNELAQPSKRDWAQAQKAQRETNTLLTQLLAKMGAPASPESAKPNKASDTPADTSGDAVATLRREIAFKDALSDAGLTLSREQRQKLEKLYAAESPEDVGAWITSTAQVFGFARKGAEMAANGQPKQNPVRTDTGSPGAPSTSVLSFNPNQIAPDVFASLPYKERVERVKAWLASGTNANPFRRSG